ncbi:fungal-specific transcription factor domain-containing protein [Thelonectria olida]|uniref:Fungal-specific transcription factor domain-containing protein n=1 Tax=Thelonectria olida TaxID=1576542 RepID=A0A9P9ANS9_9HYPO|nr:fungal-specific transcription factor domain-containing protein [Thelonectria olida]
MDPLALMRKKACDACHKRKIQCEKVKSEPACDWCRHHDLSCTFNRVRGRRKKAKPTSKFSDEQSLSYRLEHIEDALDRLITRNESSNKSPDTLVSAISTQVATITRPPNVAFTLSSFERSSVLSIPSHELHSSISLPAFSGFDEGCSLSKVAEDVSFNRAVTASRHSQGDLYDLPEEVLVRQVLEQFSKSSMRLIHPVIDPVLFEETITQAYSSEEDQFSVDGISARACVLAFVSVMCYLQGNSGIFFSVDCTVYAAEAYRIVSGLLDTADIVVLQTITMLHLYHIFSGHYQSAILMHSVASRLVFLLGGHVSTPLDSHDTNPSQGNRMKRQLRMLFWQCYIFDKHITLRTGNPPLIQDDYCDLTPLTDHDSSSSHPNHSSDFAFMHQVFPTDLSLSHLKSKTYNSLYSPQAKAKSDADVLRTIRELDDELENWRLSLPAEVRPALSILDKAHVRLPELKLPPSTRYVSLHLEYHHLIITIHQASGRLNPFEPDIRPQLQLDASIPQRDGAVQSSNNLSLEASRSTLVYLGATLNGLVSVASWVATLVSFYPAVAVKALCLNILADPLGPQAQLDMQLMRSTALLIRGMPLEGMPPHKRIYMQQVDNFVAEMIRLASGAMSNKTWDKEQLDEEMEICTIAT